MSKKNADILIARLVVRGIDKMYKRQLSKLSEWIDKQKKQVINRSYELGGIYTARMFK